MKNGQTPVHRQKWYPADYHADEWVQLLQSRRDYRTLTFYRHFMDMSFMAGGDLPADPEMLSALVRMPKRDVVKSLEFCVGKLIHEENGRLYQRRVIRDLAEEMRFRDKQLENGRRGGRPPKETQEEPNENPSLSDEEPEPFLSETPPTPTPIAYAKSHSPGPSSEPSAPVARRKRAEKYDPLSEPLPLLLATPEFKAVWVEFVNWRRTAKRNPYESHHGPRGAFKHLEPLGPEKAAKALEICMEKGWIGVEYGAGELLKREAGPVVSRGTSNGKDRPGIVQGDRQIEDARQKIVSHAYKAWSDRRITEEQRAAIVEEATVAKSMDELRAIQWPKADG